jgi:uncharacterized protein
MKIEIEKNVPVRLRDGVELATDVYRPAGREQYPTLLQRLPYDKELVELRNYSVDVLRAVQAGYAVIVQDTRGRYGSGGEFTPFVSEAADGAEAIAWAAAQPWSSGRVGMFGGSYFGATQWLAATEAPPALGAIAPFLSAADPFEGWAYQGGAFSLGFCLYWSLLTLGSGDVVRRIRAGSATRDDLLEVLGDIDRADRLFPRLPLTSQPQVERVAPYYLDWLAHPTYDAYWRAIASAELFDRITAPALNVGGWFDLFLGGTLAAYRGMKERGGSTDSRRPRLIVGPWAHGNQTGAFPERGFGIRAGIVGFDLTGATLGWFDRWLKGEPDDESNPVTLFVMGADEWRLEPDWPLPDTQFTRLYLRGSGGAQTASGDGALSPAPPGDEPADSFVYDPSDPVPTVGGSTFLPGLTVSANSGPRDQRALAGRKDILCFTTEPLERDLEVIGPVDAVLFVSSSALDTDFTAKLVDVHPDGRAMLLCDGILRARYRESISEPSPLEPGRVYELRIDLRGTANVFAAGHRIRLDVSSSNFPRFDRNTNTGGAIAGETGADFVRAVNRVFHDPLHPSHVVLPVIDRR